MAQIESNKKLLTIIPPLASRDNNGKNQIERISVSPLWMVTTEPLLNEFVMELQRLRLHLMQEPHPQTELYFSRTCLNKVRTAFANMIRMGEEKLHLLCQLLCGTFLSSFQIQSIVIGEVETTQERFTLSQTISREDLFSVTDIDLGTRQINKLQFFDGNEWSKAALVANVVDYQPTAPNPFSIHRISSRIKAEEEIWNKVVDEIFELDRLVFQDKKLRHLSRFVKDIFGIKIVVGEADDVLSVYEELQKAQWSESFLKENQVQPAPNCRNLQFIETKNYLKHGHRKESGWEAVKSVVRWSGKTFEIQIQPLRNFLREREYLTRESHSSFKANRERVRNQVAASVPLFRFYQDLLRWLFLHPQTSPPTYKGITANILE